MTPSPNNSTSPKRKSTRNSRRSTEPPSPSSQSSRSQPPSQPVSVSRNGSQRPTLLHEPDGAADWSWSDIAVEWAAEVAAYDLDDWQSWLVRWTFARRGDGLWAASDIAAEVPRQNGKNIWLEVVELASLILFGDRLITHSAHRADTSHEHFVSLKDHIQANDELMSLMPKRANDGFVQSHGLESIEFGSGARLQFKARATSSGRGPRPQKIVLDECLILDNSRMGSMTPGITAQRNPQVLYASSSPKATSEVLHDLRRRAITAEPGDRLFYAGWCNPQGTAISDVDAWYLVNPSLGRGRMTETSLMANRNRLDDAEFLREHLGVPELPLGDNDLRPIPLDVWDNLARNSSAIVSHDCWALSVSTDRKWSSFGIAGRRDDAKLHVECIDRRANGDPERLAGTTWVLEKALEVWNIKKLPLRICTADPANAFIAPLRERGVEVIEVSRPELSQATGQVIDAANAGELVHLGQPTLDKALRGAKESTTDGARIWSQRLSSVEITPLIAVTVAAGGVPVPAETSARVAIVLGGRT